MGWDVDLVDENGLVHVPRQSEGSIISISNNGLQGTTEASMSVTYNYSGLYCLVLDKSLPDFLNGKFAKDTIDVLKKCVEKLGTDQYTRTRDGCSKCGFHPDVTNAFSDENRVKDYWCPTMGNAGHIASILLDWANLHPNAKWEVSK